LRKGSPLFKKGCKPWPGRPKSSTNVMTRILKEAILMACENVGNQLAETAKKEQKGLVSYLEWAALNMALLGRIMPREDQEESRRLQDR
jgi:hypothetical protein